MDEFVFYIDSINKYKLKDVLALIEKTEEWVKDELQQNVPIESLQLATVDEKGQINILLKKQEIHIFPFYTYDTMVWTRK